MMIRLLYFSVGMILLLNAIYLYFVVKFNLGLFAQFLVSVFFILFSILFEWFINIRIIPIFVYSMTILFLVFCFTILLYGRKNNVEYDEDAVIVLGAGIRGEKVSDCLAKRLDAAIKYHGKNPNALIVVSGGKGKREIFSEAFVMERYLIEKGVEENVIIKEDRSTSTIENFSFSNQILSENLRSGSQIAFITNDFHILRSERIAKSAGLNARHFSAGTTWYILPMIYFRELIAYIDYYFLKSKK